MVRLVFRLYAYHSVVCKTFILRGLFHPLGPQFCGAIESGQL